MICDILGDNSANKINNINDNENIGFREWLKIVKKRSDYQLKY